MRVSVVAWVAWVLVACGGEGDFPMAGDDIGVADHAAQQGCTKHNAEGKKCDDGLFCTVDDTCRSGVCVGVDRPCGSAVGFCSIGVCNESSDSCAAEPREEECTDRCPGTQLTAAYRKGWKRGFESVAKVWDKKVADCDRGDEFADRIAERVAKAQTQLDGEDAGESKPRKRCRNAGVSDGAFAALDVIQNSCAEVCFLDGELTGRVAAPSYCELAMGADGPIEQPDWTRGPLNTCGLNYEVACDSVFIGDTLEYARGGKACADYTVDEYAASWDASRERVCDYHEQ
jgi:hypothetical protein